MVRFSNLSTDDPARPLDGFHQPRETFITLLARGYWPVAIHPAGDKIRTKDGEKVAEGKEPIGKGWGLDRGTVDKAYSTYRTHPRAGVGLCLGPDRAPGGRWLIDVEGDGPEAEESRGRLFGGECFETMGWASVRGCHQLLLCDGDRLDGIAAKLKPFQVKGSHSGVFHVPELPGLELRIGGFNAAGAVKQLQSVVPPTPGTDGTPREWNGIETPADAPEAFYAFLESLAPTDGPAGGVDGSGGHVEGRNGKGAFTAGSPKDRPAAWLQKARESEFGKIADASRGARHDRVLASARTLAGYLHYYERHGIGISEADLEEKLINAANVAAPEREGDNPRCVKDAIANGKASPLYLDEELHRIATGSVGAAPSANGKHAGEGGGNPTPFQYDKLSDEELGILDASTLAPERVEWLVENRIARGKLNLIAGEGGDGKSQLAILIAAAITNGGTFPGATTPAPKGDVFILAAEDGTRDTIIPRLIAAGADLSRVKIITAKVTIKGKDGKPATIDPKSFQDLGYWRESIGRYPQLLLIIADPIPAFLGRGVNDHKNADVRAVLEPFVDLLSETRVATIGITHLGKSTDLKTPVHKILGSVAYGNLARSVHLTVRDPEDKNRRFLCHPKVNIGEEQPTLAFRIEGHVFEHDGQEIKTSRAVFDAGTVDMDAAALMGGGEAKRRGRPPKKTNEVTEWLYDFLAAARRPVPLAAVFDAAGEKGFIGERLENGKWSIPAGLYRAKDAIPTLPEPRAGCHVEDSSMSPRPGVRNTIHWSLAVVDCPF